MALIKKKEKEKIEKKKKQKKIKEQEPQYYLSATHIKTINYKVYYMSKKEKIVYFLLAFVVGMAVGYLFYGGLAKDEYGQATMLTYILNAVVMIVTGIVAGKMFLPIRTEQILNKRKTQLKRQFRDMLDGITTSLGAGKNVIESFVTVREDLSFQYEESAFILKELDVIITGLQNNIPIEEMLADFGFRSGNTDIINFAEVFKISYRKGGNIKDIVRNTHSILSEKMEIEEDIETVVTSNKTEQNIMIVMPVALIAMIKSMSPEFASNYATPAGIIATTIAITCFIAAYYIGKIVLDIKV